MRFPLVSPMEGPQLKPLVLSPSFCSPWQLGILLNLKIHVPKILAVRLEKLYFDHVFPRAVFSLQDRYG